MKKYTFILMALFTFIFLNSCKDDDKDKAPGNPVITPKTNFANAMFGDSLPFKMEVSDSEVPLSTLKVRLYFGEELVSEKVIRTKTNGEYEGKLYIPFHKNVPNGTAKLKFILQNVHITKTEQSYDLALTRPDYPYLTLVTKDGEYRMDKKSLYQYEANQVFPMKVPGYIKTPKVGSNGNELTFGWEENAIAIGSTANIPFSNSPGKYAIAFNTLTYDSSPFIIAYTINDVTMQRIDDNNFKVETNFTQGGNVTVNGIDNFSDWWIDADYFNKATDGTLTFAPITGKYRVTANFNLQYLKVEAMSGNDLASVQADGTGVIWIIGDNIGKPSTGDNWVGWEPNNAICMAPIGGKKYQVTVVAGESITADAINFKFFLQKGWGGEFKGDKISTTSDIVMIGTGPTDQGGNGVDSGNLALVKDKTLTVGATYVFTVDLSAGNDKAVLTVVKK